MAQYPHCKHCEQNYCPEEELGELHTAPCGEDKLCDGTVPVVK